MKKNMIMIISVLALLLILSIDTSAQVESIDAREMGESLVSTSENHQSTLTGNFQQNRILPRAVGSLGSFERFTRINDDGSIRDPHLLPKGYIVALSKPTTRVLHNGVDLTGQDITVRGGQVRITDIGQDAAGLQFDGILDLPTDVQFEVARIRLLNQLKTKRTIHLTHVYKDDSPVKSPVLLSFNFTQGTVYTVKQDELYTVLGDDVAEEYGKLTIPSPGLYNMQPGTATPFKLSSNTNIVIPAEITFDIENTTGQGGMVFYTWNGVWADVDTPAPVVTGAKVPNYKEISELFSISQYIPRSTEKGKFQTFSLESNLNGNLLVEANDIEVTDSTGLDIKNDFNVTIVTNLLKLEAKDTTKDAFYERYINVKVNGKLDMAKVATWSQLVTANDELLLLAEAESVVDGTRLASNQDDIIFSDVTLPTIVTVKYQDLLGNELAQDEVTSYDFGETYSAIAKDLSATGWTLDSPTSPQGGIATGTPVEIIFKYRKGKVTILTEYYQKDQTGKLTTLFPTATDTYEYHKDYQTLSKEADALAQGFVLESSDTGDPASGKTGDIDETLTVKYVYIAGEISLSAPATIDFGDNRLISIGTKDIVPTENIKVSIIDQLPGKWELMLEISTDITSDLDGTGIKGAFRFIQNDGTPVDISTTPKAVYSKKTEGIINGVDLEWDAQQDKGLVFKQLPGNKQGGYSGAFTWTLVDGY